MSDYTETTGKAKKPKDEDEILRLMRDRFDQAELFDEENRIEAECDLLFYSGGDNQWDEKSLQERRAAGRPVLTTNKLPQFVHQVTGQVRQNKPAIKVRPTEDGDKDVAEIFTGLIRNIEQQSDADSAYVKGAENATICGMGHWRILTEYSSDDAFELDIRIRRIANSLSVLWDPLAKEQDKSDANFAFVIDQMPIEEYKARFPCAAVSDFDGLTGENRAVWGEWLGDKVVRVAEYWVKKPVEKKIVLLSNGEVLDVTKMQPMELEAKLVANQLEIVRERKVKTHKVCQYIVSGNEILEGPNEWDGKYIPIITVTGEEVNIGEQVVRKGMVRDARDPQTVFNYMRNASIEVVALQPKTPYMVSKDQINGYEHMWNQLGKANLPYVVYNASSNGSAPQRVTPPTAASGLMAEIQQASEDLKATFGIYDAGLGARSNETSGKAIMARQREGDTGTFVYVDNLAKAIAYTGRQLIDLIPKIYDTQRIVRTLGEDGSEEMVTINQPMIENGQPVLKNDLSVGKYDVVVETGPSYTTKRVEAAESMMAFMQAVPQSAAVIADLIPENMDWPGAEEVSNRLRKFAEITLPPGVIEPKEGEQPAQIPPPPPNPKDVADAELKAAQAEGQKLENLGKGLELDALLGGINQQFAVMIDQKLNGFVDHLAGLLGPQPQPMPMEGMPISPEQQPGIMLPQGQPAPGGFPA